jgi:hypothetical protein
VKGRVLFALRPPANNAARMPVFQANLSRYAVRISCRVNALIRLVFIDFSKNE